MYISETKCKEGLPYIPVTFELTHSTPCQLSAHGSPPTGTHPGRSGNSRAAYKLFSANTNKKNQIKLMRILLFPYSCINKHMDTRNANLHVKKKSMHFQVDKEVDANSLKRWL